MEQLNEFVQNTHVPILAALVLGMLTAIAPCPMATNITATAFIARNVVNRKLVLLAGLFYVLGRMVSYTVIGVAIFAGASKFQVARIFQGTGERYIGFFLVIMGILLLCIHRIKWFTGAHISSLTSRFQQSGVWGSFILGVLFALAFCPYSGAVFFGMLMPMTVASTGGVVLPVFFSIGTGLPVILLSLLISSGMHKLGLYFNVLTRLEKIMRIVAGVVFILTGLYYINLFFHIL